jgi:hypothetical protein
MRPALRAVLTRRSTLIAAITNIVIEGDSQTTTTPDQGTNRTDFYSYVYADDPTNSAVTFHNRGQGSRTIGGPAFTGPPAEGADTGTPTGNTLLDHRPDDIAYGPQLLTAMLGSNDFGPFSVDNVMARWLNYAPTLRAAGVKLAIVACPPYHPSNASAGTVNPKVLDYWSRLRNSAILSTIADYYIPLGEHPDFRDAATRDTMFNSTDLLHMTPGAGTTTSGQYRAYTIYKAAVDTIRDASRVSSTSMYSSSWPTDQTNLSPSTTYTVRIVVKGIAHAGLTSGASVSGASSPTISLNGGTPGTTVGTNSGNGRAIYNGDVLDVAIPLSASNNTAVSISLTIGGETRSLSYTTAIAVTPATYAHEDVVGQAPASTTHTYSSCSFTNTGVGLLAVRGATPTGMTVGGVAATRQRLQTTQFNQNLSVWTVTISATGARNVVLTYGSAVGESVLSWGVVKNADPTVQQTSPASDGAGPGSESSPQSTASLTVPTNGIAIGFFGEYGGGTSVTPATAGSGTTLIDEGQTTYLSEVLGIAVGTRTTTGAVNFVTAFGDYPRAGVVFKAFGT